MNQRPSMKEVLEKRKARHASKEKANANIEHGNEQEAANDALIAEVNSENVATQPIPKKKRPFCLKEHMAKKRKNKERGDQAKVTASQMHAHDDESDDDEGAEASSHEDDDESVEHVADVDADEPALWAVDNPIRRPGMMMAIASRQKKPYPVHAFGSLASVIRLIARAVQVDMEMVGSSLLGVVSALAQALINVSAKAFDAGCPVTLNMFIIALSGDRKSTTIAAIDKPVLAAINRATDSRRNMLIQDVTVDGMIVGLIARCHSQLLLCLEGASLLGGHAMKSENLGRFLGNVSSLYSGEALSRTRVEEHHYAEDRRLSVLLFTQPAVAMEFLSSEIVMQQGLGNRFMYSQPPSLVGSRKFDDIELDDEPLYKQYCAKITNLANQPWKINPDTGGVDTRTVRMSDRAKEAWVEYYNSLELAVGPGGDLATHAAYATRFPEQVMRLAALLAILENPKVEIIDEEIMKRAIELGSYYLDSAMNAFDVAPANKDELDAGTLLDWMRNKLEELDIAAIPVRMMYKDGPRCARPKRRTQALLDLLVSRGEITEHTNTVVYGPERKRSNENFAVTAK